MNKAQKAVAAVLCFAAGSAFSALLLKSPDEDPALKAVKQIAQLVRDEHLGEPIKDADLYHAASKAMAAKLEDKYSTYMTPAEVVVDDQENSGSYGTVGITIKVDPKTKAVAVKEVVPDSPAAEAELKPKDVIVEIDGEPIGDEPAAEAMGRIRGTSGEEVTLTIRRGPKDAPTFDVTMVREETVVPSVTWKKDARGLPLMHVIITAFNEDTGKLFNEAIHAARVASAAGIILDLRNNTGGLLNEAEKVICSWVSERPYVLTRRKSGRVEASHCRKLVANAADFPAAVLINERSASSSEVTAGALQDYGFAKVFGKKSYGKGVGQNIYKLVDGGKLILLTFEWLTPKGKAINGIGITPDETVDVTLAGLESGHDAQYEAAANYLRTRR